MRKPNILCDVRGLHPLCDTWSDATIVLTGERCKIHNTKFPHCGRCGRVYPDREIFGRGDLAFIRDDKEEDFFRCAESEEIKKYPRV